MKIEVRCRGFEASSSLLGRIERRVAFQLGRFDREIARVSIRIDDVNGPKGGVDTWCRVIVQYVRSGSIALGHMDTQPNAAVDCALARLARVVARKLEERRSRRPRQRRERRAYAFVDGASA
jgi:ribosome-associated translation inhibitor RaiA